MSTAVSVHWPCPASIFARSSTWLMRRVSRSVSRVIAERNCARCTGSPSGSAESNSVKARMEVLAEGDGSRVVITTDLEIRGRAAQMGAGMITSVSKQLIGQAAACIGARIAATGDVPDAALPVAGEVSGIGLVASAASAKVGDAFRRLGRKGGEEQG